MGRKTSKKRFFFGFSDKTPGKRFAIFLYSSDDAQTYRIAAQLDVRGVDNKKGKSNQKQITFWAEKRRKKGFFLGFPIKLQEKVFIR